jgi:arylformamidase
VSRLHHPDEGWIDISVRVDPSTPEWPGDTPFACRWTWEMARGDSVNVSTISGSPHVGTHADAPFHVDGAWAKAEEMPLSAFAGPATVVDVTGRDGALSLAALGTGDRLDGGRVLLRTGCSIARGTFPDSWPWLDVAAVRELLGRGLTLLGVDAPSVDGRDSKTLEVHRTLFSGGAFVLENLDLDHVLPGRYYLSALPMRLAGLDAAPVRAALRRMDQE